MEKKTKQELIKEAKESNAIQFFKSLDSFEQRMFIEKLEDLRDEKLNLVPKEGVIQSLLAENQKLYKDNVELVKLVRKYEKRENREEIKNIYQHPIYQNLKKEKQSYKKSVKKLQDEVAKYRNICIAKGLV